MLLAGARAVVSGGGSGLGAATVAALVAGGARVASLDLRLPAGESHPEVRTFVADVADAASVDSAMAEAAAWLGGIDICVNCAGLTASEPALDDKGAVSPDLFRRVIGINLEGTFLVLARAAAFMRENPGTDEEGERGVIVNTASIRAYDSGPNGAAYAASKGGVAAMTLGLAREFAPLGIRVCSIAPGLMRTPMLDALPDGALDQHAAKLQFPRRFGRPDEFARLAVHIIENTYLNGETIRLDGAIRV